MQVSLGFDERHFQKGGILEQPWKQFMAADHEVASETNLEQLFADLSKDAPEEAPSQEPTEAPSQEPTEAPSQEPTEALTQAPVEVVSILEVSGPVLQPLSSGVPAWLWVIFGILVFLLLVAIGQGTYQYWTPKDIDVIPVVTAEDFRAPSDYLF